MKKLSYVICGLTLLLVVSGCASESRHHRASLPDPASFNAHFGDMDADGDDGVNWEEFKSYFSQATPDIFNALDLNKDDLVDHDEWHEFKEAHGMRHHE